MSKGRYMMGTKAIGSNGAADISRDDPDLCIIFSEEGDDYVGNWVEGFGFVDVHFPKATTRELTPEERTYYNGKKLDIGNGIVHALEIPMTPARAALEPTQD